MIVVVAVGGARSAPNWLKSPCPIPTSLSPRVSLKLFSSVMLVIGAACAADKADNPIEDVKATATRARRVMDASLSGQIGRGQISATSSVRTKVFSRGSETHNP